MKIIKEINNKFMQIRVWNDKKFNCKLNKKLSFGQPLYLTTKARAPAWSSKPPPQAHALCLSLRCRAVLSEARSLSF